jgi:hypothetical protein
MAGIRCNACRFLCDVKISPFWPLMPGNPNVSSSMTVLAWDLESESSKLQGSDSTPSTGLPDSDSDSDSGSPSASASEPESESGLELELELESELDMGISR